MAGLDWATNPSASFMCFSPMIVSLVAASGSVLPRAQHTRSRSKYRAHPGGTSGYSLETATAPFFPPRTRVASGILMDGHPSDSLSFL